MEILTWNILSGGFKDYGSEESKPERFDRLVEAVKGQKADVVCLVDTHRWPEIYSPKELQEVFGYPSALVVKLEDERLKLKGHDNGVCVMSRVYNSSAEVIRMVTRNAIKISTPEIDIFCVYLDDVSEDTRLMQISSVLKMVNSNRATIITGDLNTIDKDDLTRTDQGMAELAQKFPVAMKGMEASLNEMRRGEVTRLLVEKGFVDLGKNKGDTVPAKLFPLLTEGPIARLDYAFGNPLIEVEDFKVFRDERFANLSDHYPIWMKVKTSRRKS